MYIVENILTAFIYFQKVKDFVAILDLVAHMKLQPRNA